MSLLDELRTETERARSQKEAKRQMEAENTLQQKEERLAKEAEQRWQRFLSNWESAVRWAAKAGKSSADVYSLAETGDVRGRKLYSTSIGEGGIFPDELVSTARRVWEFLDEQGLSPVPVVVQGEVAEYDTDGGMHSYRYTYSILARWG